MLATLSKFKGLIIGIVLVVLLILGYTQFIAKKSGTSDAPLARVDSTSGSSNPIQGAAGREFVIQLLAIQSIHFNSQFFSDPAYLSLHDFSKPLVPQPVGRLNPFAPIGDDSGVANAPAVSSPIIAPDATSAGFIKTSEGTSTKAASTKATASSTKSTGTKK